jgi:peptidoglycan/xylan/chitin deacetylase (PgdA/CDA1 family)
MQPPANLLEDVRRRVVGAARSAITLWHYGRVRCSNAGVALALCYHAVDVRDGDPARELSAPVGVGAFERQVLHLRRWYRIVPASELREAASARRRGERVAVAITFDDDLPSHLRHAAPALQRAGVPATFFLTGTGLVGRAAFWWDMLQRAWDRGLVDDALLGSWGTSGTPGGDLSIRDAARAIQAMEPAARDAVVADLRTMLGDEAWNDALDADAIASLARGFEIGFHTRRHHELVNLDAESLAEAMREGRDEVERVIGRPLHVIAYPHGRGPPGAFGLDLARALARARRAFMIADRRPS